MRIALRTSGGRGEYELAGSQGSVNVSDLMGCSLFYELTPELVVPGYAFVTRAQGKPRIRLSNQSKATHLYRVLAAVMLLPKPIRELSKANGSSLLRYKSYSITAIKVDVARLDRGNGQAFLSPTDLLIGNAAHEEGSLAVTQRMSRILRIWRAAESKADSLSNLLRHHHNAVRVKNADHKHIERTADEIIDYIGTDGDPLPLIESELFGAGSGIIGEEDYVEWGGTSLIDSFGIDDDLSPEAAARQRVRQWRLVAVRGAEGVAFRNAVSKNYDFRCMFTGVRMPKIDPTSSSGVDAAHILPWATHNINSPVNGICLSKQCHWAFDEGVLRLNWDRSCNSYVLSVPHEIETAAKRERFDLGCFQSLAGPIPRSNLPADEAMWPDIKYLAELNRFFTNDKKGHTQ